MSQEPTKAPNGTSCAARCAGGLGAAVRGWAAGAGGSAESAGLRSAVLTGTPLPETPAVVSSSSAAAPRVRRPIRMVSPRGLGPASGPGRAGPSRGRPPVDSKSTGRQKSRMSP
ncbi:hypothetical protein GCM10009665_32390 [Kitasatospora nipponensis]|uniref:Uncharacterized protein n=1 Tax=Kitasatospora nipponensis TaxID=258049 RepID=A0ABP4GUS7_9ACTN